jgi:hypothetical protein
MKRKRFSIIGMVLIGSAIIAVSGVNLNKSLKDVPHRLSQINLEALTSELTSEGNVIPTKTCYTENIQSNKPYEFKIKCPPENTPDGIGDCPSSESLIKAGSTDRCHKVQ